MDFGVVEDGGGVAEDEVDAPGDVGGGVELAAVVGEEGVLMAEEADVLEDGAVRADGRGDGLTGVAGGVLDGEIVGLEVVGVDFESLGEVGSAGLAGVEGVGDDDVGRSGTHADEGHAGAVLGDDDALVVGAGVDLDEDAAGAGVGGVVHGHLDGGVLGGGVDAGFDVGADADVDVGVRGTAGAALLGGRGQACYEKHGDGYAKHGERVEDFGGLRQGGRGGRKCTGRPTAPILARYRCFLPDLAGLAGLRRVGPGTRVIITP